MILILLFERSLSICLFIFVWFLSLFGLIFVFVYHNIVVSFFSIFLFVLFWFLKNLFIFVYNIVFYRLFSIFGLFWFWKKNLIVYICLFFICLFSFVFVYNIVVLTTLLNLFCLFRFCKKKKEKSCLLLFDYCLVFIILLF